MFWIMIKISRYWLKVFLCRLFQQPSNLCYLSSYYSVLCVYIHS